MLINTLSIYEVKINAQSVKSTNYERYNSVGTVVN